MNDESLFALPDVSRADVGMLVAAILFLLALAALVMWLRATNKKLAALIARVDDGRLDQRDRDKERRELLKQMKDELRNDVESVASGIRNLSTDVARLKQKGASEEHRTPDPPNVRSARPAPIYHSYEEPHEAEDPVAQLLAIANRIVQQSSTTLDGFRASTGSLAARISAWPSSDGIPLAFIVEYRGTHYAIPNVVKPARLPQNWFNRSDFGVNDEIQRVVSLPRLKPRGKEYDVQEAGVFAR